MLQPEEFLQNSLQILSADEHNYAMNLKADWDVNGRPLNHTFIHFIMILYRNHEHIEL